MNRAALVVAWILAVVVGGLAVGQSTVPVGPGIEETVPVFPAAGTAGPDGQQILIGPESERQALRQQLVETVQSRIDQLSLEQMRRALVVVENGSPALPPAAEEVLQVYQQQAGAIQRDAERKMAVHRRQAVADLKEIQDKLTRAGQLDDALAVRDLIRSLNPRPANVQPDPGSLTGFRDKRGQPLYFRVTAAAAGSVWGTDVYTDDSALAAAAVHAGALRNGQTGIVKVTMLPGRDSYAGSTRHGITSSNWGSYSGSYRVEAVRTDEDEDVEPPAAEGNRPRDDPADRRPDVTPSRRSDERSPGR